MHTFSEFAICSFVLDAYPKLTSLPSLQNPEVTPTKEVRFPCRVDYPIGQKDVGFVVTWTVDGKELLDTSTKLPVKTVLTGDSRIAYLNAMKLQGNLGKEVHLEGNLFTKNKELRGAKSPLFSKFNRS
jgi:hypothetical protein